MLAAVACLGAAAAAPAARAAIPLTLSAAPSCSADTTAPEDYVFCDDGLPPSGGTTPNPGGNTNAVSVPAAYGGDGFTGLPPKAADAASTPGADGSGRIGLDVDISIPGTPPPPGGYPLIAMMHGCCSGDKKSWEAQSLDPGKRFDAGGERWHYNNAWFASRGYVVLNYTSRGFTDAAGQGSNGEMQLDSRRFEINDFQALSCEVLAQASDFNGVAGHPVEINPDAVVATGGSYGGGFAWMALTDPKWSCNAESGAAGTDMSLAAVAPRYGWTDLAYSLVPTGYQSALPGELPAINGCDSGPLQTDTAPCPSASPAGIPKLSIDSALYSSGKGLLGPRTTFPASVDEAFNCLRGPYPVEFNPECANLTEFLAGLELDSSAYYQSQFFANIAGDASYRIPVFDAGTLTDPLFSAIESRRMINRLFSVVPDYPLQAYYGDYEHFTQNKPLVWGDACGTPADEHVCDNADFAGDFNAVPESLVRTGVTTRLNRFIDHFAKPSGDPSAPKPQFDVTAELQVCAENAEDLGVDAKDGGPQYSAESFQALAPNTYTAQVFKRQNADTAVEPNPHAVSTDPFQNSIVNGSKCVAFSDTAGAGVATYQTRSLRQPETMIGAGALSVDFRAASGQVTQMDARLYDVFPDGTSVLVDRGARRVRPGESDNGHVNFELNGNGWRFPKKHRIRVELTQDDAPYLHRSDASPSTAAIRDARIAIPVRERPATCNNSFQGSSRGEKIVGTAQSDRISSAGGRDRGFGRNGPDCIAGGGGNDKLSGGRGRDKIAGNAGNDRITGGKSSDRLRGGGGRDLIRAFDHHRDLVDCGAGNDTAIVDRIDLVKSGCEHVRTRRR